jgi:SecD/SecF fusion protein
VDGAPKERRKRSLTTPPDPSRGVSSEEFEEMVRDLGVEEEPQPAAATRSAGRPAGGRRARSRAERDGGQPPEGDGGEKPKKPRNRRHGRPR